MIDSLLTCVAVLGLWMHGGQFRPPPVESGPAAPDVPLQPGYGPLVEFDPLRWEWWFDANEDELLDLRRRLPERAARHGGPPFRPIDEAVLRDTVLPVIRAALADRDRDVRAAAGMALARLGLPEGVEPVALLAESDRDLFVRTQATLALGITGQGAAIAPLERIWRQPGNSDEIRSFAMAGLGLLRHPEADDRLARALREPALERAGNILRLTAPFAAGLSGSDPLAERLAALAPTHPFRAEPALRAVVALALGRADRERGMPLVLDLLEDRDGQVRRSAAMAIEALARRLQPADVERVLARIEAEGDVSVRLALVRALGRARRPEAREWLRTALPRAPYLQRTHHLLALGLDGHADVIAPLRAALEEARETSLRAAAAVALGLAGDGSAAPAIEARLVRPGDPREAGYLALSLGMLAPAQAQGAGRLASLAADSNDVEVVRLATLGLGLLGDRDALDRLAAGATSRGGTVLVAARLYALGKVGDRTTLDRLLAVAADAEAAPFVRAYALVAVADACDPRPLPPAWRLSRHADLTHDVAFFTELYRQL